MTESNEKLRVERIEGSDGPRIWGWIDGGLADIAPMESHRRSTNGADWVYGSLGREGTAKAIETVTAPPALRDAFEKERGAWSSRARSIGERMPSRRRKRRFRDMGEEVDIDRYLTDRPDCWIDYPRGKSLPSITLGVNMALSCGNGESDFLEVGSKAIACAWALMDSGYPVRIVYCTPLKTPKGSCRKPRTPAWGGAAWVAKDWGHPLDVEALLVCAMQGFYRDNLFGAWEAMGIGDTENSGGYGYCHTPTRTVGADLGIDAFVGKSWQAVSDEGETMGQVLNFDDFDRKG